MDTATVIVALPPVDDRVNKLSSEEVAHLTLLYLGDVQLSAEAVLYVQHACSELSPFGLSVDHRGPLGADDADVLFFKKDSWDIKRVAEFRHYLLLNDEIKRAHDSANQFPEWTPHLTLGYPETPAKALDDDGRIYYVDFDRIAVWTADFEGPEFRLEYDDYPMEVMMSDISTTERGEQAVGEMFHYGKKGMKWGVRKTEADGSPRQRGKIRSAMTKSGEARKATNSVIREKGGGPLFADAEKRMEFRSKVHGNVSMRISDLNADPRFKGKDIKYDEPLKKAYHKEVASIAKVAYQEELNIARAELAIDVAVQVSSAIRAARATKREGPSEEEKIRLQAMMSDIKHADVREVVDEMVMSFERDDLGHIVNVTVDELTHSERGKQAVDEMFHFGVKGMKWGVRRAENSQKIATKLQDNADKAAAKAERNEGKLGNGMTIRDAKKKQKTADRQQKYATKLQKKVDAKTAAQLDKKTAKDNAAATKAAHEKWKKDASGAEMANKVFQKAAKDFEKTADIINNDPNYKGKDVSKGALGRQYQATMNHYFNQQLAQTSIDLTVNDQGRAYIYEFDARTGLMRGREYQAIAQSSMSSGFSLPDYKVELGELGHMVGFSVVGELKHYGVKGMKWGVTTKDRAKQTTPPGEVKITQKKPGTYAKTTGGKGLPLSDDAKAALELRQRAKASTTDALSNRELQAAVTRMNLEQQYQNLAFQSDRRSKGARFVAGLLGQKRYGKKRHYTDNSEQVGEALRKSSGPAFEKVKTAADINRGLKNIANA